MIYGSMVELSMLHREKREMGNQKSYGAQTLESPMSMSSMSIIVLSDTDTCMMLKNLTFISNNQTRVRLQRTNKLHVRAMSDFKIILKIVSTILEPCLNLNKHKRSFEIGWRHHIT